MRQIPAWMLTGSASYYTVTENAYGQSVPCDDEDAIPLTGVYVEIIDRLTLQTNGEQPNIDAVLYFDAENSYPSDQLFRKKEMVKYLEDMYLIREVKPFVNPMTNELHHWEVSLVSNG